ncbi:Stk1 family PASTA domain-containing Ser/Thr kinase [Nocardia stercoris]|uniref:non-specific serine/threonine protein kinase n=1 Tax=Nocardia stercoris TaxID=2483361 RepID=A0A3M2KU51_9NOCA|nr:Stk1 family PASTA domain-containing Ser/Thr kinase [Nocardia stercoris]
MLDERYRIDAPIARGGMSMVFLGEDTRLDRPVAIKVMDPKFSGDPQFVSRFEFEARSVAKLKHPSLVAVYDQGVDREYPFLIMELVEGGTLRELLRERGPMPPHAVRAVAQPALAGLAVAHHAGLIHRDIKPENLLISDAGEVKIADFGLVRAVAGSSTTSASVILGTAAYLSPEQVTEGTADARSDVYSFGILIFEMLTGRTPFTGDTSLSIAYQRVEKDVPPPSSFIEGVPPEFDELVARATAREPVHRFADAAEMGAELERIAAVLGLPDYRVPSPKDSAEHLSAKYKTVMPARPAPQPPRADDTTHRFEQPAHTQVLTAGQPIADPAQHGMARPVAHEPRRPQEYLPVDKPTRRRTAIWATAAVVVLALVLGAGAWWAAIGQYTSVPSTAGMTVDRAAAELQSAGFKTSTRDKASETVPVGGVVGTDPAAGAHVAKGSTVAVLVSSGKPKVPALQPGAQVTAVEQAIRDAGLIPVRGGDIASQVPKGTVAQLDPAPGTELPGGAMVKMYTSKGSTPVPIPDVRGRTEQDATTAITNAGLSVKDTRTQFDSKIDGGVVVGTDPGAGTSVLSGNAVTLLISNAVKMPDVTGQPAGSARGQLEALGLKVNISQILSNDRGTVRIQSVAAGTRLEPGTQVVLTVLPF